MRVEEPAGDDQPAVIGRERAKGHHGGIGRSGRPLADHHLLRRAWRGLRRNALRNHIEDAGIVQVVVERGVEDGLERGCLGIAADGLEVSRGQPDCRIAQVGSGVNPVLCAGCEAEKKENTDQERGKPRRVAFMR